jgi:ABC-type antimicrobial peptide transport system permease subunit
VGIIMAGLSSIALGTAPILGGALLGIAAGQIRAPDVRSAINQDLDLLDRLPEHQVARREALQRTIDERIDDLVAANERGRRLRAAASSYEGNWRDIVLFLCAVLFTIVWWNVSHARSNWLLVFIAMIAASVIAAMYAARGSRRALRQAIRRNNAPHHG